MAKKVATAIFMCAVMVLVAAAPMALGGSHYVPKGDQGPRANAVTWEYVPASLGKWAGHITNDGLRSLVVEVYDITTGAPDQISHQRIRFASYGAYPTGVVDTEGVAMAPSHKYSITVTPSGPKGSSCTVDDVFIGHPPIAMITVVSVDYLTVVVDGSSSDPDGTIASYAWDFGDGSIATGMNATHTYAMAGTYTITLTVTDNDGSSSSASELVTVVEPPPPTASFTVTASGLTVNVDASASTGYGSLSYTWDWGDGTTGSGMTASHAYAPSISASTVSQTLSGKSRTVPHPIFGFTYAADGVTALPGCYVTITNVRTGETLVWDETREFWDPDVNIYSVDLTELYYSYRIGDVLNVTATKGAFIGWTEAPVTDSPGGYDLIDVILHSMGGSMTVTITLTVTDMIGGTDSVGQTVTLAVLPVASFSYTAIGPTVNVDATASSGYGIISYAWDWGDGTIGTGRKASHTYSLTESMPAGSGLAALARSRPPPPHAVFGFTYAADGVTALPGCYVTVTNARTGETLIWDETRSDWDPNANVYSVDLSELRAGFRIGDILNVTAMEGTSIGWTEAPVTDNPYGYDQIDVTLHPREPIVVTITLTVTDTVGQTDSVNHSVTLILLPKASFTYSMNGQDVTVDASGSSAWCGIVSYVWIWGDGTSGTGKVASHTYSVPQSPSDPATKTMSLIVTDALGQTDTANQSVHIQYRPTASFSISPISGNIATTFAFDASSSSDFETPSSELQIRWDWDNDGVVDTVWSTEKQIRHQFALPGTYRVRLEVLDTDGYIGTTTKDVTVFFSAQGWTTETLDSVGEVGRGSSIAIDSNNKAHISYWDATNSDLKYATNVGGSWAYYTLDSGSVGEETSIAVDSRNNVHISYLGYASGDLKYATNAGGSWVCYTLDTSGYAGYYSSIAIDSNDKVHICYTESWGPSLMYATNAGGSWAYYVVDSSGDGGYFYSSMALDSNNNAHISYCEFVGSRGTLKYATNAGGPWICSTIDGVGDVGYDPSIAVDSNDAIHISYTDVGNRDLRYATNAGGSWAFYTLDSVGSVGSYSSIAVDSNDALHITYLDLSNMDLKYASNAGGLWAYYTLDYDRGNGNGRQPTSIAVDSNNVVHISYSDGANNDLKHAVVA